MPWNALTVLPGLNASDMKIGLLITARMGSTRLKDKHLQTIGNHLALDCLLGRVRNEFAAELLSGVSTIWIATGNPDRNQAFNQFANGLTVRVFNGDDDNVPLRHLQIGALVPYHRGAAGQTEQRRVSIRLNGVSAPLRNGR